MKPLDAAQETPVGRMAVLLGLLEAEDFVGRRFSTRAKPASIAA